MKNLIIYICIISSAVLATIVISIKLESVFFFIWLAIPYFIIGLISIKHSKSPLENIFSYFALFLISIGGLYIIADVIYLHPDPQGGVALFILPPIQIAVYGVLVLLYRTFEWVSSNKSLRSIDTIGYCIIGFAELVTVLILVKAGLKISPILTIFVYCWVLAPYFVLSYFLKKHCGKSHKIIVDCISIVVVSAVGIYFYLNAKNLFPSLNNVVHVGITPIVQFLIYGIFNLMIYIYERFIANS